MMWWVPVPIIISAHHQWIHNSSPCPLHTLDHVVFWLWIMPESTTLTRLKNLFKVMVSTHLSPISMLLVSSSFFIGCCIEYLPPCSPDYNVPIEQAFSTIKSHLRQQGITFFHSTGLYYELYCACDIITAEVTWGFFAHAGIWCDEPLLCLYYMNMYIYYFDKFRICLYTAVWVCEHKKLSRTWGY